MASTIFVIYGNVPPKVRIVYGLTTSANKQQQITLVELSNTIKHLKAFGCYSTALYSHAVISTIVTLTNLQVYRVSQASIWPPPLTINWCPLDNFLNVLVDPVFFLHWGWVESEKTAPSTNSGCSSISVRNYLEMHLQTALQCWVRCL